MDFNTVEEVNERTRWYIRIQEYARKHYEMGWDFFVEGIGLRDFLHDMREYGFVNYDEAFDHYCQRTVDRLEAMEEARGHAW